MTDEQECPLSELPATQCACPTHRGGQALGDVVTIGQAFLASYSSTCARGCSGIEPGDQIARCWDATDGYAHAGRCR